MTFARFSACPFPYKYKLTPLPPKYFNGIDIYIQTGLILVHIIYNPLLGPCEWASLIVRDHHHHRQYWHNCVSLSLLLSPKTVTFLDSDDGASPFVPWSYTSSVAQLFEVSSSSIFPLARQGRHSSTWTKSTNPFIIFLILTSLKAWCDWACEIIAHIVGWEIPKKRPACVGKCWLVKAECFGVAMNFYQHAVKAQRHPGSLVSCQDAVWAPGVQDLQLWSNPPCHNYPGIGNLSAPNVRGKGPEFGHFSIIRSSGERGPIWKSWQP